MLLLIFLVFMQLLQRFLVSSIRVTRPMDEKDIQITQDRSTITINILTSIINDVDTLFSGKMGHQRMYVSPVKVKLLKALSVYI